MQCRILVIISFVDTYSSFDEYEAILQLIGLRCNVKGSFIEISERIDVDLRIDDQPFDDFGAVVHGGVMDGRPVALVSVVDVDGQLGSLAAEVAEADLRLVLQNRLQEVLVQLVEFLPI
jgi:hypothetical protein